jgi:fibro-slime domain-containing protein
VKYKDSLPFVLDPTQGPETYVFSRKGDLVEPGYFPLDTINGVRVNDPPDMNHNYSFCTELHTTFKYQSGLKFDFWGDDDVWVFINRHLVIDLGGVHKSASAYVDLDAMTGLTYGQKYDFDLYQCERCPGASVSRMVTNIARPQLKGKPVASWKRDYGGLD